MYRDTSDTLNMLDQFDQLGNKKHSRIEWGPFGHSVSGAVVAKAGDRLRGKLT